jgi:prevent-host-death family protein
MDSSTVNLYEAKTQLSSLVERAARGEEIVIAKAGRPVARLVPLEQRRRLRLGSLAGKFPVPDDFDRLAQDEIEEMFHGKAR